MRTWNSSAPPRETPPGTLLFPTALLSRQREWLFKGKNAERGDTPESFSISSSPSSSFTPAVALFHPALTARWNRRQMCVPYGVTQVLQSVQILYHLGHYIPRFRSLTSAIPFLRKLAYCPDVVAEVCSSVLLRLLPQRFSNTLRLGYHYIELFPSNNSIFDLADRWHLRISA